MLNFKPVRDGQLELNELIAGINPTDLRDLTNAMVDHILDLIRDCVDGDVVFTPDDLQAYDPYAKLREERRMAWNLGHVIVHITASAEESAALAAEMARGVSNHGRSRYETPWNLITSIEMCRNRLEESRRMRLASLAMWPEKPHLDLFYQAWKDGPEVNAIGRFVLGLMHEDDHLEQIKEIVRQAKESRNP